MENTYQVYIVRSGDGQSFYTGLPVASLEQATGFVHCLDWLWSIKDGSASWPEALHYYEGGDVYALNTAKDELYFFNENNEWELVNAPN